MILISETGVLPLDVMLLWRRGLVSTSLQEHTEPNLEPKKCFGIESFNPVFFFCRQRAAHIEKNILD